MSRFITGDHSPASSRCPSDCRPPGSSPHCVEQPRVLPEARSALFDRTSPDRRARPCTGARSRLSVSVRHNTELPSHELAVRPSKVCTLRIPCGLLQRMPLLGDTGVSRPSSLPDWGDAPTANIVTRARRHAARLSQRYSMPFPNARGPNARPVEFPNNRQTAGRMPSRRSDSAGLYPSTARLWHQSEMVSDLTAMGRSRRVARLAPRQAVPGSAHAGRR